MLSRLLLNPLQRTVRERQGFPILPGAFPVLGHLPAMFTDRLELVRRGVAALGPLFFIDAGFGGMNLRSG